MKAVAANRMAEGNRKWKREKNLHGAWKKYEMEILAYYKHNFGFKWSKYSMNSFIVCKAMKYICI